MFQVHSDARRRVLSLLAAIAAATLPATGCTPPPPDQSDAKVTVQATQPAGTYSPGDDVKFRLTITNAGSKDVAHVSIESTIDSHLHVRSQTCSELGIPPAAQFDNNCLGFIYPASIPKGGTITIDFVATVMDGAPGTLSNSFTVALLSGPAPATTTSTASVVDTRSGAYTAWTSDGRQMAVTADFAGRTLAFSNADLTFSSPFQTTALDLGYHFDSHTGFMQQPGRLVGNVAIGGTPRVFLAARTLVSRLADLDGRAFDVFSIDTAADGTSTSRFATAQVAGATLTLCADPTPQALATCPAASLHAYAVSETSDGFTAIDGTSGDTIHFQATQVGSAMALLRAEPSGTGRTFSIGLAHAANLVDGTYWGGDTAGQWRSATLGVGGIVETFTPDNSGGLQLKGPLANIAGTTLAAGSFGPPTWPVWAAQSDSLLVVMGRPGTSADGLLQLFAN